MNEISDAYDELFERKRRENLEGLESAWVGDDMKKEAGYIDYTVSKKTIYYNHSIFYKVCCLL